METLVDITGLDKAEVLAALYNASKAQGLGLLHFDPRPMTKEVAQFIVDATPSLRFDYTKGRVMKVDLSGDSFSPWGFDRDNGSGAAQAVIDQLRERAALQQ